MPTFIALPQARTWGTDVLLGEAVERRRTAGVSASAAARSPAPAPAAAAAASAAAATAPAREREPARGNDS